MKEVKIPGFPPYNVATHGPLASFEGLVGFKELEQYWIEDPFSSVVILKNESTGEYRYHLVEPDLSEEEGGMLREIREVLKDTLPYEEITGEKEDILEEKFVEIAKDHGVTDAKLACKFLYYLKRDDLGLGKIDPLMKDEQIEDISCDGVNIPIFIYHRKYYNLETNLKFGGELDSFVLRLAEKAGEHLSYSDPVVESSLPDGSRIQVTLGTEVTTKGSSFSIRKFLGSTFTPVELIKYRTFSPEMLAYLWIVAENGRSTMIIGGTASGKTSTLNALAFFIPPMPRLCQSRIHESSRSIRKIGCQI